MYALHLFRSASTFLARRAASTLTLAAVASVTACNVTEPTHDIGPTRPNTLLSSGDCVPYSNPNSHWITISRSTGFALVSPTDWTSSQFGTRGTFVADVNGDGKADLIGINDYSIGVRLSTGSGFGAYEVWSTTTFSGTKGTYFADVTGDGKADAIANTDAGVLVRPVQTVPVILKNMMVGTKLQFGVGTNWTAVGYAGSVNGLDVADVNADGKADAIVVNDWGVTIRRSTGTSFSENETWTGNPYYGSRGTYFADVDGDRRADAIVVNDWGVTVRRSTGSAFAGNEAWTANPYYGSQGTYFADVTGDGRADAVVLNGGTVTVRRSTGSSFSGNETWKSDLLVGWGRLTFGDVTGDRIVDAVVINNPDVAVMKCP